MAVVINAKGTSASTFRIGKSGNYLGTDVSNGLFASTDGTFANLATIKVAPPTGVNDATTQQYVTDQIALTANVISQLNTNITITDAGIGSISHVVDGTTQYTITDGLFDLSPNTQFSAGTGTATNPAIAFEGSGTGDVAGFWFDLAGGPAAENQVALSVDGLTTQKWRILSGSTSPVSLEYEMSDTQAKISAVGAATDINIKLVPKGVGQTLFGDGGTQSAIASGNSTTAGINGEDFLLRGGNAFDHAVSSSSGGSIILTPGVGNALAGGGTDGTIIIRDANNLTVMDFNGVASSINYFTATNSSAGSPIKLSSTGTDINIGIELAPKGSSLITAPVGYDMSGGPNEAIATKGYVDGALFQTQNKSTAYTTTLNDDVIFVNSSGGVVTVTLGTSATIAGKQQIIKDVGGVAGTNNITIATQAAQTIDGQTTKTIINNYESVTLMCNGTNWFMV